ncbi:MAG: hypothetical protein MJA29_09840, partial [Candidatus Omnitrophica bacterium]|nr:hypothetical protein [Candidatus Omnitrophota bacterium]
MERCPGQAPSRNLQKPTIKTSLYDKTVSKSSNPTVLKTSALETIDSYPRTWIHAYTDGSAFKATNFAGFGVYLNFPDGSTVDSCAPCGNICSNYEAEVEAILSTLKTVQNKFELGEQPP